MKPSPYAGSRPVMSRNSTHQGTQPMTSVLNNIAANTALLNLQNTVQNLQNTQQQISTGYKIGSAADNAAYFAISTVLQSDSNALSTVSDTLNLGGASLGVATNALAKIQTTLSDIKNQLLAATTPGVDRVKIQAQITQDQAQLESIAELCELQWAELSIHGFRRGQLQRHEVLRLVVLTRRVGEHYCGDHRG